MGFYIILIVALYCWAQIQAPIWGYRIGKMQGRGKAVAVLFAVAGFLLVFAPVWYKELPATFVFHSLKREAGTVIHKPFEQWVAENPGVPETLERNGNLYDMRSTMGDLYPNRYLEYQGNRLEIFAELRTNGKQRLGWYNGRKDYAGGWVTKAFKVLYDIEKKELLAASVRIGRIHFGMDMPGWWSWYSGSTKVSVEYFYDYWERLVRSGKQTASEAGRNAHVHENR